MLKILVFMIYLAGTLIQKVRLGYILHDNWGKHSLHHPVSYIHFNSLLFSRKVLTLVDLDSPTERVTKLTRQSKWDISCVQWHPYPNCGDLFATAVSTCNTGEC